MPVLTGILLDMSGSMKCGVDGRLNELFIKSISKVVNDLINNNVAEYNHMFAVGVGASGQAFEMFNTLRKAKRASNKGRRKENILVDILRALEENGAPGVRRWVTISNLLSALTYDDAVVLLDKFQHDRMFARTVAYCLPLECRTRIWIVDFLINKRLSEISIEMILKLHAARAKGELFMDTFMSFSETAVTQAKEVVEIICNFLGGMELTDGLREAAEPDAFSCTPLIKALNYARETFAHPEHKEHDKFLFVLSDKPTEGRDPSLTALSDLGVTCFFIQEESLFDPFYLFSREERSFLFRINAPLKIDLIPRTHLVKKDWKIDLAKHEIRLQCKRSDIISEVSDLAKNMGSCYDALSYVLKNVSLDEYINQVNTGFCPKNQIGGTCYANACATVLHLAMHRIVGRVGGYPNFFEIRQKLISEHGVEGAVLRKVLDKVCPEYRLQYKLVTEDDAKKAIAAKRPVIATFKLTNNILKTKEGKEIYLKEWAEFSNFFSKNPHGILTQSDIDITGRPPCLSKKELQVLFSGHAVVLTSYDNESLRFMNSWGQDWADGGFFRVQSADVLDLCFYDVFWTLGDLHQEEKDAYDHCGQDVAKTMTSAMLGLFSYKYNCPKCFVKGNLNDFSGNIFKAQCLNCYGTFKPESNLFLKLYLTSLLY